jgi:hypothetical protein
MSAIRSEVFNRGSLSQSFLYEMVAWANGTDLALFDENSNKDIYSRVIGELGPFTDIKHRTAVMLEVMRVLALFESGGNWLEGVDTSKSVGNNSDNEEAGAWQVSWDSRKLDHTLQDWLNAGGVMDGKTFQHAMKYEHVNAMNFIAMLLRIDMSSYDRIANGPIRKGIERQKTWPNRRQLWDEHQSIYPWLSRDAVAEFQSLLTP